MKAATLPRTRRPYVAPTTGIRGFAARRAATATATRKTDPLLIPLALIVGPLTFIAYFFGGDKK